MSIFSKIFQAATRPPKYWAYYRCHLCGEEYRKVVGDIPNQRDSCWHECSTGQHGFADCIGFDFHRADDKTEKPDKTKDPGQYW